MLARSIVAVSALLSLPILATAASLAGIAGELGATDGSSGTCTTGALQCCQAVGKPTDSSVDALLGPLLGVILHGVTAVVGVNCSPITAIGVGISNSCQAQPACCPDNAGGNLVSIGCVPVSL